MDRSRRPQVAHNFDICTVRALVWKTNEKRGRDTDPGGVLLGILGGGMPPGSSNPGPISDRQKCHFPQGGIVIRRISCS